MGAIRSTIETESLKDKQPGGHLDQGVVGRAHVRLRLRWVIGHVPTITQQFTTGLSHYPGERRDTVAAKEVGDSRGLGEGPSDLKEQILGAGASDPQPIPRDLRSGCAIESPNQKILKGALLSRMNPIGSQGQQPAAVWQDGARCKPLVDPVRKKGRVGVHIFSVVRGISRRVNRLVEIAEPMAEGSIDEEVEPIAEDEGPGQPGPAIAVSRMPADVPLVPGLEGGLLTWFGLDDHNPRESRRGIGVGPLGQGIVGRECYETDEHQAGGQARWHGDPREEVSPA